MISPQGPVTGPLYMLAGALGQGGGDSAGYGGHGGGDTAVNIGQGGGDTVFDRCHGDGVTAVHRGGDTAVDKHHTGGGSALDKGQKGGKTAVDRGASSSLQPLPSVRRKTITCTLCNTVLVGGQSALTRHQRNNCPGQPNLDDTLVPKRRSKSKDLNLPDPDIHTSCEPSKTAPTSLNVASRLPAHNSDG